MTFSGTFGYIQDSALFIVHNADDAELIFNELDQYFPVSEASVTLLTTRSKGGRFLCWEGYIEKGSERNLMDRKGNRRG